MTCASPVHGGRWTVRRRLAGQEWDGGTLPRVGHAPDRPRVGRAVVVDRRRHRAPTPDCGRRPNGRPTHVTDTDVLTTKET
jgi:hypothetical protein